jgi:hypothetical protein
MKSVLLLTNLAVLLFSGCSSGPGTSYSGSTQATSVQTQSNPPANSASINFASVGNMTTSRANHVAVLLPNGKVLIAGGVGGVGGVGKLPPPLASAELYDPAAGTFTSIGNTKATHEFAAAARLVDGTVLITGGQLAGGSGNAGTDLYDPATDRFTSGGNMTVGRHEHTATLLPDGTVLIAGGHTSWPASTASAEIYTPPGPFDYLRAPVNSR